MKTRLKPLLVPACVSAGMTLAVCLAAAGLLRSLGSILTAAGEEQFGAIFEQIRDARLFVPFWIPLILFAMFGFLLWATDGRHRTPLRIIGVIFVGVLLFVPALVVTIWFTNVNGIRVGRVVLTLLGYLKNGIADSM